MIKIAKLFSTHFWTFLNLETLQATETIFRENIGPDLITDTSCHSHVDFFNIDTLT